MLRRVLSEYCRKETENRKFFGGVVGLDGRCSAQAEQRKKPVAVVHLPGAYLSTETNLVRNEITATLERLLQQVDALHLPSTCKLWLYQHFVVTKLCWFFTALDLSQTFVKSLQSKATKFLKSWSGLPRSANTTILFLGKSGRTGLHVTNLVTYWKQMQLVRMDILKRSADPRCNRVYDALLKRQTSWLRKYPPAVEHACATTVVDSNPGQIVKVLVMNLFVRNQKR